MPNSPAGQAWPRAWLVLVRTTVLAFGYLPARGIALPPGLDWTRTVLRSGVTPLLLLALTVLLVVVLRPGAASVLHSDDSPLTEPALPDAGLRVRQRVTETGEVGR